MSKPQQVQEANTNKLLRKQGVNGTAIGKKWVNGVPTEQEAVLIFVQKKFSAKSITNPNVLTAFSAADLIPEEIDGVPTDVIEVGKITKQGFKGKVRPIRPGYSVGHGNITAGTIGGIFTDKSGIPVILSNNHVLANENNSKTGDLIFQPGPTDSTQSRRNVGWKEPVANLPYIATLRRFNQLKKSGNLHDSAIAAIHPSLIKANLVNDTYPQINTRLTGFGDATVGMQVQKCGRTTGYTTGQVLGLNASFTIAYDFGEARFDKCVVLTAMSQGGDSGSIIQDMGGRAVALLFAGSPKVTIANPIGIVRDYYGLKLYSDAPSKVHNGVSFGGFEWYTRAAGADRATIKSGVLNIDALANHSCCLERPISNFKTVQCTVNTGSGGGATWGTGLSVHWPNGYAKLNLRNGGTFGGYVNGSSNISIGKVKPNTDYVLRFRKTGGTYIGEIQDNGIWYTIIEAPISVFPYSPTMVRIGKTDLNGNLSNYHVSGPNGATTIKGFTIS